MPPTKDNSPYDGDNLQQKRCGSGCGCHQKETPSQKTRSQETQSQETQSQETPFQETQPQETPSQGSASQANNSPQEDYKDKYLRLLAENENLRRRLQRESQESIRFATQRVILDLLDPYDHFEKALFHASHSPSEEVRNWGIGFKMIHQQFKDWLHAQGVHSYPSKGQRFSAELHEAVEVKPCIEEPEGIVIEELFKGYKMHERVLRHAKVIISGKAVDHSQAILDAERELSSDELDSLEPCSNEPCSNEPFSSDFNQPNSH